MIAAAATFYLVEHAAASRSSTTWPEPDGRLLRQHGLFNGNPLMRYDGYYVLADWLEIPNLRDRANRYLQNLAMEYCLGIEVQPEPYMELWRQILFVVFAVDQLRLPLGGDVRHLEVHGHVPQAVQAGGDQRDAGGRGAGVDGRLAAVSS